MWFKLDGMIVSPKAGVVWEGSLILQAASEDAAKEQAIAQMKQETCWEEGFEAGARCIPLQSQSVSYSIGLEQLFIVVVNAPIVQDTVHHPTAKKQLLEIAPALLRQFINEADDESLRNNTHWELEDDNTEQKPTSIQIFHLPGLSITHEDVWNAGYDFYGLPDETMQAIAQKAAERIQPQFMKELIERACTELKIPERSYVGDISTDRYWLVYEATSVALGFHSFELKVVHIPSGKARNATLLLIQLFLQEDTDQPGQMVDEVWRFPSPQVHRWMSYFKDMDSYGLSRLDEVMNNDMEVNTLCWIPIGDDPDLLTLYQDSNGHRSDR